MHRWESDQGYDCKERTVATDVEKVLRIAKRFYETGRYATLGSARLGSARLGSTRLDSTRSNDRAGDAPPHFGKSCLSRTPAAGAD